MANTSILFRGSLAEEGEYLACTKYFNSPDKWTVKDGVLSRNRVFGSRSQIPDESVVIARYSALPYYDELEKDLQVRGSRLINSYAQHRYVARFWDWYRDLRELTPESTMHVKDLPYMKAPFVVKGTTNSRKHRWNTHMFAPTAADALQRCYLLQEDSLILQQGIIFREYEPFVSYGEAINGLPITKEFRFFIFNNKVIGKGFYWANQPEVIEQHKPDVNEVPEAFIQEVIKRVDNQITFWVVDVAQHQNGNWRVVELNDGQMSGLSTIDPDEFYCNLAQAVAEYDNAEE